MHDRLCFVNGLELVLDKPHIASCPASPDMATLVWDRVGANSNFETNTNTNSIRFLKMKRIRIRILFGFQKTIRIYSNSANYSNMNTNSANSSDYLTMAG